MFTDRWFKLSYRCLLRYYDHKYDRKWCITLASLLATEMWLRNISFFQKFKFIFLRFQMEVKIWSEILMKMSQKVFKKCLSSFMSKKSSSSFLNTVKMQKLTSSNFVILIKLLKLTYPWKNLIKFCIFFRNYFFNSYFKRRPQFFYLSYFFHLCFA